MIAEVFPRAWQELLLLKEARGRMAERWAALLDAGLFEESVTTESDGRGSITACADWPFGAREALTNELCEIIDHLWRCLDSLVVDSIAMHSNRHRISNPAHEKYFPVAPTWDEFEQLLSQGCLDGLRADQARLVLDCQAFRDPVEEWPELRIMQTGLRHLLDWTHRLDRGAQVGAWATPVEPQVEVAPPAVVRWIETASPGVVEGSYVVARFVIDNYDDRESLFGRAGTYLDIALCSGFEPSHRDDTLSSRVKAVIDAVLLIAAQFAQWERGTPGIPALVEPDRTLAWRDARLSSHRWSPRELSTLAEQDLPLGLVRDAAEQTLIIGTDDGVFERVIRRASALNAHVTRGVAAERATLSAAATWGLPDFVLRPIVEVKGSGVREISDGLLVPGALGVILQSKSREGAPQANAREHAWVNKQIRKAVKQVNGTHRRLGMASKTMRNGRGRLIEVDGTKVTWAGVIVVDHPDVLDGVVLTLPTSQIPYVVLTRAEWEFLFDQLKSTRAVVEYIHRVERSNDRLGEEALRYYELADADLRTLPSQVDPALLRGGPTFSTPHLPQAPAGHSDPEAFDMLRHILEDVALTDWSTDNEGDRLEVLAAIDSLIVARRENIGRFLLGHLATISHDAGGDIVNFQSRSIQPIDGGPRLSFIVASRHDESIETALQNWLLLRHYERRDVVDWERASSIAILITPRQGHQRRSWDTTAAAVKGALELDEEFLTAARALWGTQEEVAARQRDSGRGH